MKPLRPCTSRASPNPPPICPEIEQQEKEEVEEERNGKRKRKRTRKKGGIVLSRTKRIFKDSASDSFSSSSSITMATASSKKNPRRNDGNALRDLALPLGMSFAAIVSQVLDGTNKARNQIPIDRLSLESKSWWVPKPWASFNSGFLVLQCHAVALTRMLFGLFMILSIAYSVFQRSAMSTPTTMPVTFILLLLGFGCGVAGKLCVDTLGGSGLHWLLYWEVFCLVHFFASIFPAAMYRLLYGPLSVSHMKGRGSLIIPYWFRRSMFYLIVSTVYPAVSGLLPFASMGDWKEHFAGKLNIWMIGVEN